MHNLPKHIMTLWTKRNQFMKLDKYKAKLIIDHEINSYLKYKNKIL